MSGLEPEEGELILLFEDEHFIAIDKPAGLLSQPNPGDGRGSVLNVALHQGLELIGGEDPMRQGLVHRLDRDTTGVLLLSKSQAAYEALQNHFRKRTMSKLYRFLGFGQFRRMEFTRKDPLGRHPLKRHTRMVDPDGRQAETHFRLLELLGPKHALWEAQPKTGRTHQIRVHAKAGGVSILGDPHYGDRNALQGQDDLMVTRTLLHCAELSFEHPFSQESLRIEAPLPGDMAQARDGLRA